MQLDSSRRKLTPHRLPLWDLGAHPINRGSSQNKKERSRDRKGGSRQKASSDVLIDEFGYTLVNIDIIVFTKVGVHLFDGVDDAIGFEPS